MNRSKKWREVIMRLLKLGGWYVYEIDILSIFLSSYLLLPLSYLTVTKAKVEFTKEAYKRRWLTLKKYRESKKWKKRSEKKDKKKAVVDHNRSSYSWSLVFSLCSHPSSHFTTLLTFCTRPSSFSSLSLSLSLMQKRFFISL